MVFKMVELFVTLLEEPKVNILKNCFKENVYLYHWLADWRVEWCSSLFQSMFHWTHKVDSVWGTDYRFGFADDKPSHYNESQSGMLVHKTCLYFPFLKTSCKDKDKSNQIK